MNPDLRRFHYSLEPLRNQRKWQLDSLTRALSKVLSQINDTKTRFAHLQETYAEQRQQIAQTQINRIDPTIYQRTLQWLVDLQKKINRIEEELVSLQSQHQKIRKDCLLQQQKVDVIESHRNDSMQSFLQTENARLANEADREWIVRHQWRKNVAQINVRQETHDH